MKSGNKDWEIKNNENKFAVEYATETKSIDLYNLLSKNEEERK